MDDTAALETRIRLLERAQRRLVLVSFGLAMGLGASILSPAFWAPREVSAQRFLLKDASGETRGEWGPTDVLAGEIDGETQHASATCLHLMGQKSAGVDLCAPWDSHGGPMLAMSEESGASLHVALDAYTVSILGSRYSCQGCQGSSACSRRIVERHQCSVSDKKGRGTPLVPTGC